MKSKKFISCKIQSPVAPCLVKAIDGEEYIAKVVEFIEPDKYIGYRVKPEEIDNNPRLSLIPNKVFTMWKPLK